MDFKFDENLGDAGAEVLREAGHDVMKLAQQQMNSAPDATVYDVCRKEARVLVTLDTDFADPLTYPPEGGPGIAVMRIGTTCSAGRIKTCLSNLLGKLSQHSINGKLWIDELHRVREYRGTVSGE